MKQIFKRKGSGIGAQGSENKGISSVRTGFAPVPAGNFIDLAGLKKGISIGLGIVLTLTASAVLAVAVTGTINTFSSGNVVDASQINTNFTSLKTAIEGITSSQWMSSGSNIYYNAGAVSIGTSIPDAGLDIVTSQGMAYFHSNKNNNSVKNARLGMLSYSNAPYIPLTWFTSTGSAGTNDSGISIGGGTLAGYAASTVTIYTAANDTTLQGTERVRVTGTGNVGIGTTSPTALLHVAGTAGNNTGTWSNLSDERLKKNIFDYKGSLEKVLNLRPVSFEWKENKEGKTAGRHIGFIAQEVEKIFPEWVSTMSDGNKWMTPEGMNAVLVQSIRELKSLYDNEKSENAKLKQKLLSVEERLNALEKRK
ncbi:MAG TPA: tail fiber domain-containing protein [Leptospiraceae bacterium]|nr:tail fiber domain-containing protein [Leptospiraceae bacterium]